MKKRVLVPVIPAVASLALAAPALAANTAAVSENWAGYEITSNSGAGFSAASGSWKQPAVKCTPGQSTYSAFWVGLGGGARSSSALEQQGTQADCSTSGRASYYAWYELVPSAPVRINMRVSPGDEMYSRTSVSGDQVTVQVQNRTTGQNFVKTLTMTRAAPDTSTAEWVAEAPSQCSSSTLSNCQVLPLSNFGSVRFTNARATSAGHTGTIGDPRWTATPIALSGGSSGLLGGDSGFASSGLSSGYGAGGYSGGGYPGAGYSGGYLYGGGYGYGVAYTQVREAPYGVSTGGSGSSSAAPGQLSADGSSFTVTYGSGAGALGGSGSASASLSSAGYSQAYGYSGYGGLGGYSGYGGYGYSTGGLDGYYYYGY